MNWADLSLLLFTGTTALTAGISAASAKAGWTTPVFSVAGVVVGFLVGAGVRWFMNRVLTVSGRQQGAIAGMGFLSLYLLIPMVLLIPVIHGTGVGTEWLVKHLVSGIEAPNQSAAAPNQ
jgi:hypothetical protein